MPKLNFPPPTESPWLDPNDQWWQHDGDGWIARYIDRGDGTLPPGIVGFNVLTVHPITKAPVWADLDAQYF